jgi:eukaryotic-like serine/threonine-protein kinase
MTAEPAGLTGQRKSIPPAVEAAVFTALEKLPADRFATAAEFAAALAGEGPARTTTRVMQRVPARAGPWRGVSAALGLLVLGLAGLSAWALRRVPVSTGPAVFDAALPDTAAMTFAATTATTSYGTPLRNISVSPAGDFAVYAASRGDSTALWYRSLRDATVRPIPGTVGATAPRVSPDGSRVAFLVGGRVMVVPIGGGEPRRLRDGQSPSALRWTSPTTLLLSDLDGNRLTWMDPEGGQPRISPISRCTFAEWIPEDRQLLCSLNSAATVFDPETGRLWPVRSALPDGSEGAAIAGTAFRVLEGRFLVYLSPDGDLRAAPYDRKRHLARRSVTLVGGIRREAVGEAQYDLTANGTLVYAAGADAMIGRIVRLAPGGPPAPLALDAGVYQRFDLSRDRRWLAAVVITTEGQELRVHDLRNGQRLTWLRGEYIRHPLWEPGGERLMAAVRDGSRWSVLAGVPGSGAAPDTLYTDDVARSSFDPLDYQADTLAIAQAWNATLAVRFNPTASPVRFDTVATNAQFTSMSPDGRHLAFSEPGGRVVVTAIRPGGRRWQLASDGAEPLWLSSSQVLYRSGVSWYSVQVDARTGEPAGAATFWARDPRFSDTSGWSNRPSHDGGIIYLQGPAQVSTGYLRIIPDWVAQMKLAVDAANR